MHCVLYNSEKTNSPLRLLILCFIHLAPASITHRLIWVEHKIKYVIITFLRWKHLYNMLETFSGDKRRDSLKTNQVYTITHGSLIKLSQMFLNILFYCLIVVTFETTSNYISPWNISKFDANENYLHVSWYAKLNFLEMISIYLSNRTIYSVNLVHSKVL